MASLRPHPACSLSLHRPTPPGSGCARERRGSADPRRRAPTERGDEPPQPGVADGCYKEVWIDSEKKETEIKEQEQGGGV